MDSLFSDADRNVEAVAHLYSQEDSDLGFLARRLLVSIAALETIEENSECSIGLTVASKHGKFCAYHTAREALRA